MKTIELEIEDPLLDEVDRVIHELSTTRSAFFNEAAHMALKKREIRELEQQHIRGYERFPVQPGEFDEWEAEQEWGEP